MVIDNNNTTVPNIYRNPELPELFLTVVEVVHEHA